MPAPGFAAALLLLATVMVAGGCRCTPATEMIWAPQGTCAPAWEEGRASVDFVETPAQAEELANGRLERELRVLSSALSLEAGHWTARYDYQARWQLGQLRLTTTSPWAAPLLDGHALRWRHSRQAGACADEPREVAEDAIYARGDMRSQDELLLYVLSAPLKQGELVAQADGIAPEIQSIEWQDVGCPGRADAEGRPARTVGLVVTTPDDSWGVAAGERSEISINGLPYEIAVTHAEREDERDCGRVELTVARAGFLESADAGAPDPDGGAQQ